MATDVLETRLASWLRGVSTVSPDRLEAIREGARAYPHGGASEILDLVLLACGEPMAGSAERLREAVATGDVTFAGEPSDLETHIGAGAALAVVIGDESWGWFAAQAVESAVFCGLEPAVKELVQLSRDHITSESEQTRKRVSVPSSTGPAALSKLDFSEHDQIGGPQLHELLQATRTDVNAASKATRSLAVAARHNLAAADEEIDLLWWVLAERVAGDGDAYNDLGPRAAIAAGLDVASRTPFTTPQRSSAGLIARVLPDGKTRTDESLVEALDQGRWEFPDVDHRLLPLLSSLHAGQSTNGAPSCKAKGRELKLALAKKRDSLELAQQALRERLLAQEF